MLFVNCNGKDSTYEIRVGMAGTPSRPFLDQVVVDGPFSVSSGANKSSLLSLPPSEMASRI